MSSGLEPHQFELETSVQESNRSPCSTSTKSFNLLRLELPDAVNPYAFQNASGLYFRGRCRVLAHKPSDMVPMIQENTGRLNLAEFLHALGAQGIALQIPYTFHKTIRPVHKAQVQNSWLTLSLVPPIF